MRRFRDIAIRRKLVLVMMAASAAGLLLASGSSVLLEIIRYHKAILRDLSTQAQIVGANGAAALAFGDTKTAQEILSALHARPEIVFACLYTTDGKVFAEYNPRQQFTPPPLEADGHEFTAGHVVLFRQIKLGNDPVGAICLRADLSGERAEMMDYAAVTILVMLAALGAALALSTRLQRLVSEPIMSLASVAAKVREEQDYSQRAEKLSDDEIGALVDAFNQMLAHVQKRDEELRASEQRFRQLAETIHEVFWMTDPDKTKMIYISPAYEEVWGRTCASLYENPAHWIEAIHSEDRERVRAAADKQARGEYDEEYRIIRPSGGVRWIRDRAFPIRDGSGKVYRIAGIAEDITERRRLERQILEISDSEQGRIGQDLHDGLCQHLVSIAFAGNLLRQKLAAQSLPEEKDAQNIAMLLDDAITQARNLARGLYPVKLEVEGFGSALEELAGNVAERYGIDCLLECPEPVAFSDNAVATHLYRIVQEAVNNSAKHSQATRIVISATTANDRLTITVSDNGIGIPEPLGATAGMGLHIMRYRARMIGGQLKIGRGKRGGTIILCSLHQKAIK